MAPPETAAAVGLLLQCAQDLAVLNADLPAVAELAGRSAARRILWVTQQAPSKRVADHIAAGGAAALFEAADDRAKVVLHDAGRRHAVSLPAGLAAPDPAVAVFAVALAYGLGLPVEGIAQRLSRA
jgi:UDP-N-acetylmuramyl tripeptide synthase